LADLFLIPGKGPQNHRLGKSKLGHRENNRRFDGITNSSLGSLFPKTLNPIRGNERFS
jgi:hypothetical protein